MPEKLGGKCTPRTFFRRFPSQQLRLVFTHGEYGKLVVLGKALYGALPAAKIILFRGRGDKIMGERQGHPQDWGGNFGHGQK